MQHPVSPIDKSFFTWADEALSHRVPDSTVAFHFNLYEGVDSVHVQLIGTQSFAPTENPEIDYWPGAETFSTGEAVFEIPYAVAGSDWPEWLQTSMEIVRSYIANGIMSSVLKRSKGVGIGFVDGDMYVLWQPSVA